MLGGVWADRLPRHRVMLATDVIRGGAHALLAVLILTGAVEIWMIVGDRGRLRRRGGVLPARLHRPRAADRAGVAAAGGQRDDLARQHARRVRRAGAGDAARAGHRRGLGLRLRRLDVRGLRLLPRPHASAPARRGRGVGVAAERSARGLDRVLGAHLGVGDGGDLLLRPRRRLRALDGARPDRRRGPLRQPRAVRDARRRDGARDGRRCDATPSACARHGRCSPPTSRSSRGRCRSCCSR